MNPTRRGFLRTTVGTSLLGGSAFSRETSLNLEPLSDDKLNQVAQAPVLHIDELQAPVTVASIELLRNGATFWYAFEPRTARRDGQFPTRCTSSTPIRSSSTGSLPFS